MNKKTMYQLIAKKAVNDHRYGDAAKAMLAANSINPSSVLVDDAWADVSQVNWDDEYVTILSGDLKVYVNFRKFRMSAEWVDTMEQLPSEDLEIASFVSFPEGSWLANQVRQLQMNMRSPSECSEFD